ncbi:MAG: hypothetical protein V4572_05230 [Bacteroidota bacterium]
MKLAAKILLVVFITFLATPTIVSVIKKNADTSIFYSFSEEEKAHKEVKAVFNFDIVKTPVNFSNLNSSLIHSENLSKHDKISSKIFIPPPEQV